MSVLWIGFLAFVGLLLALDLGVLQRKPHEISLKEAGFWTLGWVALGLSFTALVYWIFETGYAGASLAGVADGESAGTTAAVQYVTAYLLEKSLSIDNIFVIALVFNQFRVPRMHRHRVLFWGVLGAIVMRAGMLIGGVALVNRFHWLLYIFGAYLLYAGVKLFLPEKEDEEVSEGAATAKLNKWLRVVPPPADNPGAFRTQVDGAWRFTTMFSCLIVIEWTDVMFALDSIPAVLLVSPNSFIIFTSNIFAILGLRSLFFMLDHAVTAFVELKYAVGAILVFIGVKLIAEKFIHIPHEVSLGVIVSTLLIASAIGMLRRKYKQEEVDASKG